MGLRWRVKKVTQSQNSLFSAGDDGGVKEFDVAAYLSIRLNACISRAILLLAIFIGLACLGCQNCSLRVIEGEFTRCLSQLLEIKTSDAGRCLSQLCFGPSGWWSFLLSAATFVVVFWLFLFLFGNPFALVRFRVSFASDARRAQLVMSQTKDWSVLFCDSDKGRVGDAVKNWDRAVRESAWAKRQRRISKKSRPFISLIKSNGPALPGERASNADGVAPPGMLELIRYSLMTHESNTRVEHQVAQPSVPKVDLNRRLIALYRTPVRAYLALLATPFVLAALSGLGRRTIDSTVALAASAIFVAFLTTVFHRQFLARRFDVWLKAPTRAPYGAFKDSLVREPTGTGSADWKRSYSLPGWQFAEPNVHVEKPSELTHLGLFLTLELFLHLLHVLKPH